MISRKNALGAIVFTVLLDMIGVGIVIPILAPLFLTSNIFFGPEVLPAARASWLGLILGLYPMAQFFAAPLWGALADRYGRRLILLFTITGTAFSLAIFGVGILTGQLWLVLAARLLDGITGGNISVATAALADISTPSNKAKNFGLIGAAFGLGFIIGPVLGGWLGAIGPAVPLFVAAGLSFINVGWIWLGLPETLPAENRRTVPVSLLTGFRNIAKAFRMANLRSLLLALFFFVSGFGFFTSFFQAFLVQMYGWSTGQIGTFFAYIGVWIVITQAVIIRKVSGKVAPQTMLTVAPLVLALALVASVVPTVAWWQWLIAPFVAMANGLTGPNISALISNQADAQSQGELMGMSTSIQALAAAWPSSVAGILLGFSVRYPTMLGAVLVLGAWGLLMARRTQRGATFHEV